MFVFMDYHPSPSNTAGGSFFSYAPSPGYAALVMLRALLDPDNFKRSANGPVCSAMSVDSTIWNRCASFTAELGLNMIMGNGALFGVHTEADVPPNIEVKWSRKGDKLIVSKRYLRPDRRYVLATGERRVDYLGWARGSQIQEPFMSHAKFLDVSQLQPMETLVSGLR